MAEDIIDVENIEGVVVSEENILGIINEETINVVLEGGISHIHINKAILDNTTESFTTALKTKLDGLVNSDPIYNYAISKSFNTPPLTPIVEDRYIIASPATGEWLGRENKLVEWDGNDWIDLSHLQGSLIYIKDEDLFYYYSVNNEWVNLLNNYLLSDLKDVTLTSISSGQALVWDGTKWTNIDIGTQAEIDAHINNISNPHSVTKTQVGLGNVDNTSDLNKPISNATQTALDTKVDENIAIIGATKTKITYDAKGLVTAGVDATTADIADSTNRRYVTDADLVDIGNLSGVNTGDQDLSVYNSHIINTSNPHNVTATQVGLGNVDNTSDINKPISSATQTALDGKVDENIAIVGSTKTKITYDSKGLVTSGTDATTADIADSTNRRYVTDADLIDIGNLSGTNTGDQIVPSNETGAANNFLTSYNNTTGIFSKARPTWANVDKTTSNIADITTRSHTSLTDIGTNTHAQIDTAISNSVSHISNTSNPHITTLEQARIAGSSISGDINAGSNTITALKTPVLDSDAATKGYVDNMIQGLDWQESVKDKDLATPPGSPVIGDRYIVATGATGAWVGHVNEIAQWTGTVWDFSVVDNGTSTFVEDENFYYRYNGSAWVAFGNVLNHSNLTGLGNDDHTQYHNDARGDARYALLASGVTNGNSHDHSGGDGAQINHTTLSNIGTNTHAQIDTHIASTSNPHSTTAAQVGLGNVTNESKATMFTNPTFTGLTTMTQSADAVGLSLTSAATTQRGAYIYRNTVSSADGLLTVFSDNATDTGTLLFARQDGTGTLLNLDMNGNGPAVIIDSVATSFATLESKGKYAGKFVTTIDSGYGLSVENAYTGNGIFLDQNGNGVALNIDHEGTTASAVTINADTQTSVGALDVRQNSAAFTSTNGVILAYQMNATATGYGMQVRQEGTGNGIFIDQNGNGTALNIDSEATSATAFQLDNAVYTSVPTNGTALLSTNSKGLVINQTSTLDDGSTTYFDPLRSGLAVIRGSSSRGVNIAIGNTTGKSYIYGASGTFAIYNNSNAVVLNYDTTKWVYGANVDMSTYDFVSDIEINKTSPTIKLTDTTSGSIVYNNVTESIDFVFS